MTPGKFVIIIVVTMLMAGSAVAQVGMTADITVRSNPQGAMVKFKGESIVSGVTPARFRHLLVGDYELTLKKHGYETYKTQIDIDPTKQMEIDVKLSPKTRFKTAVRSLFIPGWGQRYADKKTKGYAFTLLALGAGAAYLAADDEFDFRYAEYQKIQREYDSLSVAGSVEDLRRVYPFLAAAQEKAYDAEDVRRITIGVAIGVWALNVIDALFFFPEEKGTFTVKGLTLHPSTDPDKPGLSVAMKF